VKNLGREFATMSDDERRRFANQEPEGTDEMPAELDFDDPRNPDAMGKDYGSVSAEFANPEERDGGAATLDDAEHARRVRQAEREGQGTGPE